VTRYFGRWTKKEAPEYNFVQPEVDRNARAIWTRGGYDDTCCVAAAARTLPVKHDDTPALQILRQILEKRLAGMAASGQPIDVTVDLYGYFQQGFFLISTRGNSVSVADMVSSIQRQIQDLIKDGCSPSEFLAARNDLLEQHQRDLSTPSRRILLLLIAEFYRLGTRYLDIYPDQLDATIREDITFLAGKYLAGMTTVIVSREQPDFKNLPFEVKVAPGAVLDKER
jgi:predicted Zn-dependent peptidase